MSNNQYSSFVLSLSNLSDMTARKAAFRALSTDDQQRMVSEAVSSALMGLEIQKGQGALLDKISEALTEIGFQGDRGRSKDDAKVRADREERFSVYSPIIRDLSKLGQKVTGGAIVKAVKASNPASKLSEATVTADCEAFVTEGRLTKEEKNGRTTYSLV